MSETATDTDSSQLDALTVVKAQQAISGEIVLERLAATLLRVAIENAGAQRGALLLPRGRHALGRGHLGHRARGHRRWPRRVLPAVDAHLLRPAHARAGAHRRRLPAPPLLVGSLARARPGPLRALPAAAAPGGAPRGALPGEQPGHRTPSPPRAARCWSTSPRRRPSPWRTRGCTRTCSAPRPPCARPMTSWRSGWRSAPGSCGRPRPSWWRRPARAGMAEVATRRAPQRRQRADQRHHQRPDDEPDAGLVPAGAAEAVLRSAHGAPGQPWRTSSRRIARGAQLPDYLSALTEELLREQAALQDGHDGHGQAHRAHPHHRPAPADVRPQHARHRGVRARPAARGCAEHPDGGAQAPRHHTSSASSPRRPGSGWTSTRCCRSSST